MTNTTESEICLVLVEKIDQGILIKKQNDECFWAMATGQGYEVGDTNWIEIDEEDYDWGWYPKPEKFNPAEDQLYVLENVQWEKISRDLYDNLHIESVRQKSCGQQKGFRYDYNEDCYLYIERRESNDPPEGLAG